MTIGLTYNGDLSRVQIALSGLPDGTVRVERSVNQLLWETVRGGAALPVDSGAANLDDFEFAADVENFYRVVPIEPPAGLLLPGTSTDYASTPDHASLDITGDLDIRAEVAMDDWTPGVNTYLVAKWTTGGNLSYALRISSGNRLQLAFSTAGSTAITRTSTVDLPVQDGERLAVRATIDVNNGASGHTVMFYTASSIDGTWTQLGSPVVTAGTTSIFSSSATLVVGAGSDGAFGPWPGQAFAAQVRNGINGTVVANPRFDQQAHGATSFVDSTGKTWTINGSAVIIGATLEADSITPSLGGQIWLKSIRHPFLNRAVATTEHGGPERQARGGTFDVTGRSVPVAVSDVRGSRAFDLEFMTDTLEQARDLDLALASGDVFFVHAPADCPVPGGHVTIGDTEEARRSTRGTKRYFSLPCQVVAPPAPEIVGATLNWATVRRLYGDSWQNVRASNPTWSGLLDTIGDPEDLVVL